MHATEKLCLHVRIAQGLCAGNAYERSIWIWSGREEPILYVNPCTFLPSWSLGNYPLQDAAPKQRSRLRKVLDFDIGIDMMEELSKVLCRPWCLAASVDLTGIAVVFRQNAMGSSTAVLFQQSSFSSSSKGSYQKYKSLTLLLKNEVLAYFNQSKESKTREGFRVRHRTFFPRKHDKVTRQLPSSEPSCCFQRNLNRSCVRVSVRTCGRPCVRVFLRSCVNPSREKNKFLSSWYKRMNSKRSKIHFESFPRLSSLNASFFEAWILQEISRVLRQSSNYRNFRRPQLLISAYFIA